VKIIIGFSLCVAAFVAGAQSAGSKIEINPGNCASGVRLVARNALLSDVLTRLAQSLGFQLKFEGNTDSVVNVDVSMPAPELVAKLSPVDSIIVTQSRDPSCPRQNRIVKVWVLPTTKQVILDRAAPAQTSQEQSRRFEEMSRQAKEAYQTYVQIHGRPPPGEEEEVAK
jgi:hypothetical protein